MTTAWSWSTLHNVGPLPLEVVLVLLILPCVALAYIIIFALKKYDGGSHD